MTGNNTDVMRRTFEVNFFGAHDVNSSFLHLLHASPEGRIVNQSSILGSISTILMNDMYAGALFLRILHRKQHLMRGRRSYPLHSEEQLKGECLSPWMGKNRYGRKRCPLGNP